MRQITVPLVGRVADVSKTGIVKGDDNEPIGWPDLLEIAAARGVAVPLGIRFYSRLVDFDITSEQITIEIRPEEDTMDAPLDAFVDAVIAPNDTPDQMRRALKDSEPDSEKRARFDLRITAAQKARVKMAANGPKRPVQPQK